MDNMTIFDLMYPTFKIDKPIRLIELFAGVGSQAMALRDLGADFEHYRIAEWEVSAFKSYKAVHMSDDETDYSKDISKDDLPQILFNYGISTNGKDPMTLKEIQRKGEKWHRETYNNIKATNNLCSVCNFKGKDLGITNTNKYCYILTYSFPCFTGDTLVLTDKGYKQIKNMQVGDYVLTHKNRYTKVVKTMINGRQSIYRLKAMPIDEIRCTKNHRFYVREMYRTYPRKKDGKRTRKRNFKEPKWLPLNQLNKNHYIGVAINQKSKIPKWEGIALKWSDGRKDRVKNQLSNLMNNHSFWWLIGRYIGDGWQRTQGGIIICCSKTEVREIPTHLRNCDINYSMAEEKTVYKIHIPIKELQEFVSQFGMGASSKHLTDTIFDLPTDYLKSFLDGYISADGCVLKDGLHKISTVSKELAYGIAQCVAKAYKTPYRIYNTKNSDTHIVEGRVVNQKDSYQVVWKLKKCKQDKAFYEDGYIWLPIQSIEKTDEIELVYDIEVEKDHSFTANGVIAHNCQDLSVAGKMQGMAKGSGTRSGLLWEVERLLGEVEELPQVLLMENVPQVISDANIADFHKWQDFLTEKGYTNYVEVLNAKDFGVAQNRERAFMVSLLGQWNYKFPQTIPLTKTMADYLEDEVDEKYYLNANTETYKKFSDQAIQKLLGQQTSYCIDAMYAKGGNAKQFIEKGRRQLAISFGYELKPSEISVGKCITSRYHKGFSNFNPENAVIETTVKIKQATKDGYIECKLGGVADLSFPTSKTRRGRVQDNGDTCPTLTATETGICRIETPYRIRKLTPLECWKLMDFTEADFRRAEEANSNTQLYKQAGNSIVKAVLMAIFKQMM